MTFREYMKLKYPEIQPNTEVWLRYDQIWKAAEKEDYVESMENYCELVQATYQSKRDKLKKQTTHMTGKYMIVKTENNKLRSVNKAITKRNAELIERITYMETLTRRRVENAVSLHYGQPAEIITEELVKEPNKC